MKNKKNVIVTGGAGFLGSTLVPELIKAGYSVHVIDSLVSGKRECVPEGATLHEIDVRDEGLVDLFKRIAEKEGGIYGVFHLAALPRVQFSIDHPAQSHSVNVDGMRNVLEASRQAGVRRLVYSASSSAYGDQDALPLHEGLVPSPMSPYALQKYMGEHMARNYSIHYGLPTVSLRYFNIYGPNFDPNGPYAQALGRFIDMKKQGKPLTVTGDGLQTRDIVHARDVARANILALESDKVGKGEVMNIGSGRNPRILDLAKMISPDVVFIAPRVEPRHSKADIRKAKELLGWEPAITLEEGIAELKKLHGIE
ncbi:MAG TPA: NAD-dependent epimerase/dehydratase family protein [Candidatus Paceibacterota bacterium]|nr:NAD-dependent epimerase/dehydratase family protein [Candidatus Paceibacterota bacterium]